MMTQVTDVYIHHQATVGQTNKKQFALGTKEESYSIGIDHVSRRRFSNFQINLFNKMT